jgi:D-alanine-D-alanine ligase
MLILHNEVPSDGREDERDVLVQLDALRQSLRRSDIEHEVATVNLDLQALATRLEQTAPDLVVNLVESLNGSGRLAHLVPALLERLAVPFTGASATAMLLTTNKLLAKRWLHAHAIPTPRVLDEPASDDAGAARSTWIVKPVWEDASVGLDDGSVVEGSAEARAVLASRSGSDDDGWFAEEFVPGREINVSLLADQQGVVVLPVAEICFEGFPVGKPHIVGYDAKWKPDSFESRHTVRRCVSAAAEPVLTQKVHDLARRCWDAFGLRGYARVDLRVDELERPWVLEINANPCLSPDAGFTAALLEAGLTLDDAIARIVADSSPRAKLN